MKLQAYNVKSLSSRLKRPHLDMSSKEASAILESVHKKTKVFGCNLENYISVSLQHFYIMYAKVLMRDEGAWTSKGLVLVWFSPLTGVVLRSPEFNALANLINNQLSVSCQFLTR